MTPLQTLLDAGLTLRADGERLIVSPASLLDDKMCDLIRAHKFELLAAVRDAEVTFAKLIEAINRCCAVRGDTDANIAGLIAEARDFTVEAQRDLTEHFNEQAAIWRRVTGAAP